MNKTNEWASMIINELFDENESIEKISISTDENFKEANDKSKSSKITYFDGDSSVCAPVSCKDYLPDNSSEQNLNELNFIHNTKNRISDNFQKFDAGLLAAASLRKDGGIMINSQNISDSNARSNVEIIEIIDATEVVTDFVDKTIDSAEKNDILISENSIINLDEAFIQDIESDSSKADETDKNLEIPISSENAERSGKDFLQSSHKKSDVSHSFSFEESRYNCQEKINKCYLSAQKELSKGSFEELHLRHDNSELSKQFGEKNDFSLPLDAKNETFSLKEDLKTLSGSSEDHFNKVNERIENTRICNFKRENNKNEDRNTKHSNTLADLYHKWLEERYLREGKKLYSESDDGFTGNEYLVEHDKKIVPLVKSKTLCAGKNLTENANNMLIADEVDQICDLEEEIVSGVNFVENQEEASYVSLNGENKVLEQNFENKLVEVNQQWLDDVHSKRKTGINRYSEVPSRNRISTSNENRDGERKQKRSIFTNCDNLNRKRGEDIVTEDQIEINNEELEIRNQRITSVVSSYREICSMFENLFVRPFANALADTFEFVLFVFFLSLCVFCFLLQKIQNLITNCRLLNVENTSNRVCEIKEKNEIMNCEKPMLSITALEVDEMLSDENISMGEMFTEKLSLEETGDISSLVNPEEITISSVDFELEKENISSFFEKNDTFLPVICSTQQQHRAVVNRNGNCLVDFKLMNINENESVPHENYLDTEIIASSEKLHCDISEIYGTPRTEVTYDIEEITEQYEGGFYTEPVIKQKSLREIFADNCCENQKPLLNSTGVDVSEQKTNLEYECCSRNASMPASDMDCMEIYSTLQISPIISRKRENLNSSLSVNVSTFSSRTDLISESLPWLSNLDDDESRESVDKSKISNETKKEEPDLHLPSTSLDVLEIEDCENVSVKEKERNLNKEKDENNVDSLCNEESVNSNVNSCCSEGFQFSNAVDFHIHDIDKSFEFGDVNFASGSFSPNNKGCLSVKDETVTDYGKGNLKKKNCSLRRRVSLMLNNWKNAPSCILKNPKNKKKADTGDGPKEN